MKASVYERYGLPEVVHLQEVAKPTPKDDEVLIRIRATTVSAGDLKARSLKMPGFGPLGRLVFGLFRPRQPILGSELAGDVVEVGKNVRGLKVGDAVVGFDAKMGCHAEYRCMREDAKLVRKPANLSYEEAAALSFGGCTALHFLRKGKVKAGDRVLVNGAAGAVGSACVQLARHLGAEVTAVCSGANEELMRSLGASRVIDYTREDFAAGGETWDVIVDTVGTAGFSRSRTALAPRGRLLLVSATLAEALAAPWQSLFSGKRVLGGVSLGTPEDLRQLAQLAEEGAFKPVIGRRFAFDEMVEAHRYGDTGHKRGNVAVTVS